MNPTETHSTPQKEPSHGARLWHYVAHTARENHDTAAAEDAYRRILEADADDWEANFFVSCYRFLHSLPPDTDALANLYRVTEQTLPRIASQCPAPDDRHAAVSAVSSGLFLISRTLFRTSAENPAHAQAAVDLICRFRNAVEKQLGEEYCMDIADAFEIREAEFS